MERTFGGWLHGILGWPVYAFWTAMLGLAIALSHLFDRSGRLAARSLQVIWGNILWVCIPMWRRHWVGRDIGPGPWIIVANHQSVIDIPCLYGLPVPIRVSARGGIFRVKVMGRFLSWSRQIDTDHFLEEARASLAEGYSVVVFPEGSRSADGEVKRFRKGAFELAHQTGTPILPVAMDGAQGILSKRAFFPLTWIVHVHAHVLEPLSPDLDARTLAREARRVVAEELGRIRGAA